MTTPYADSLTAATIISIHSKLTVTAQSLCAWLPVIRTARLRFLAVGGHRLLRANKAKGQPPGGFDIESVELATMGLANRSHVRQL